MKGYTHKIAGVCTGAVVASFFPTQGVLEYSLIISGAVIGSLYPDIDEPNSKVGRNVKIISWTTKHFFGHRGFVHTPFNGAVLCMLLYYVHLFIAPSLTTKINYEELPWMLLLLIGFAVGYVSHLILDMLTPQGIMLLWPVSKNNFHLLDLRGEGRDILTCAFVIILTAGYFLMRYDIIDVTVNSFR